MDEKVAALVGAVAVVTIAGRAMRPIAKLGMRGIVAAGDMVADAARGVSGLYAEVREDQRRPMGHARAVSDAGE